MIDFHTHIFPSKIADATISYLEEKSGERACLSGIMEDLMHSMEKAQIRQSIVLPVVTKPSQFDSIHRFAYEIMEQSEGRLLSFGGIHPSCDHLKERLQTLKKYGFRGIKLHPDYQETRFDDPNYLKILDYASELGLIISVHAGLDPGYPGQLHAAPQIIRNVIRQVHPEKLVLAHMGGFRRWKEVEELLVGQDLWMDTAACLGIIPEEQLMRMIAVHGSERILFATDSPWADQTVFLERFQKLPLSETEKENILSKNAKKLLERT